MLLVSAFIGGMGYLLYKLSHTVEPLVVVFFKIRATYERERAKFKQLQRELRSESPRVLPSGASPAPAGTPVQGYGR